MAVGFVAFAERFEVVAFAIYVFQFAYFVLFGNFATLALFVELVSLANIAIFALFANFFSFVTFASFRHPSRQIAVWWFKNWTSIFLV